MLCEIGVFNAKMDSLMHCSIKKLVTDWLTFVQNILQSSFMGPVHVIGRRHLPTVPLP